MSQIWDLTLVTGPASEPVSLAEVKEMARIQWDVEDDLVRRLIIAARKRAETVTRRQLITSTWQLTLDAFPEGDLIKLPPPLVSVSFVKYDDEDGVEQTLADSTYRVLTNRGVLVIKDVWPNTKKHAAAVRIEFVCGYGDTGSSVPADIRHAITWLAAWWYEKRELDTIPAAFETMLDAYSDFGTYEP